MLQTEMNRIREENELLREVVEKTMNDYYNLQMKLAAIQNHGHEKVSSYYRITKISS